GHLRHMVVPDEADALDARETRGGEAVDKLGADRGGKRLRLVLEPVPGPDVAEGHTHAESVVLARSELHPQQPRNGRPDPRRSRRRKPAAARAAVGTSRLNRSSIVPRKPIGPVPLPIRTRPSFSVRK